MQQILRSFFANSRPLFTKLRPAEVELAKIPSPPLSEWEASRLSQLNAVTDLEKLKELYDESDQANPLYIAYLSKINKLIRTEEEWRRQLPFLRKAAYRFRRLHNELLYSCDQMLDVLGFLTMWKKYDTEYHQEGFERRMMLILKSLVENKSITLEKSVAAFYLSSFLGCSNLEYKISFCSRLRKACQEMLENHTPMEIHLIILILNGFLTKPNHILADYNIVQIVLEHLIQTQKYLIRLSTPIEKIQLFSCLLQIPSHAITLTLITSYEHLMNSLALCLMHLPDWTASLSSSNVLHYVQLFRSLSFNLENSTLRFYSELFDELLRQFNAFLSNGGKVDHPQAFVAIVGCRYVFRGVRDLKKVADYVRSFSFSREADIVPLIDTVNWERELVLFQGRPASVLFDSAFEKVYRELLDMGQVAWTLLAYILKKRALSHQEFLKIDKICLPENQLTFLTIINQSLQWEANAAFLDKKQTLERNLSDMIEKSARPYYKIYRALIEATRCSHSHCGVLDFLFGDSNQIYLRNAETKEAEEEFGLLSLYLAHVEHVPLLEEKMTKLLNLDSHRQYWVVLKMGVINYVHPKDYRHPITVLSFNSKISLRKFQVLLRIVTKEGFKLAYMYWELLSNIYLSYPPPARALLWNNLKQVCLLNTIAQNNRISFQVLSQMLNLLIDGQIEANYSQIKATHQQIISKSKLEVGERATIFGVMALTQNLITLELDIDHVANCYKWVTTLEKENPLTYQSMHVFKLMNNILSDEDPAMLLQKYNIKSTFEVASLKTPFLTCRILALLLRGPPQLYNKRAKEVPSVVKNIHTRREIFLLCSLFQKRRVTRQNQELAACLKKKVLQMRLEGSVESELLRRLI